MWALRRSTNQVKNCCEHFNALRSAATLLSSYKCNQPLGEDSNQVHGCIIDRNISFTVYTGIARGFASQVTGRVLKIKENKDESESFSVLDVPPEESSLADIDSTEVLALDPEGEVSEGEDQVDSHLSEGRGEGDEPSKRLLECIFKCSYKGVPAVIDKWVEDGNDFDKEEAKNIIWQLKRRKMYGRALQVSNWSWAKEYSVFNDSDHAVRMDLIFRLNGISKAEKYYETIPSEMRGYKVYQARLLNFSCTKYAKKAEEIFNKMKNAGFTHCTFDYNAMLRVYLRTDKSKISNLLKMMENESVKPNLFTYNLLLHDKGFVGDIVVMEQILETMKAEGIQTYHSASLAAVARSYIRAGYLEKAEAFIRNLEDNTVKGWGYHLKVLLLLYADIGKPSEVERVWNAINSLPQISSSYYTAGIRAWAKLGETEKAESTFEKMLNSGMRVASPIAYYALLDVYAGHNLFLKAKEFVSRMFDNNWFMFEPNICEATVKIYLKSGAVEEADAFLLKVCKQKQVKPYYKTFIAILDKYAEKGDIANAEKIFDCLIKTGYRRMQSYECLLQAYLNAHVPADGFEKRMLAAKLRPNKNITILQQAKALKNEHVQSNSSNLLD